MHPPQYHRLAIPLLGLILAIHVPSTTALPVLADTSPVSISPRQDIKLPLGISITDLDLADISPIEDFTGNLVLEFLEHSLEAPNYSTEECRDRDATYARPLKVRVRLITKEGGDIKEVKEQDIFMGDFP